MAIRARGSNLRVRALTESVNGTTPTSTAWPQLPCFSFGLKGRQELTQDNVLSAELDRDSVDPYLDVASYDGQARVPIDLENIGHWLFLLFGPASVTTNGSDYVHFFTSGLTALPSKTIEKGLSDVGQYFVYNGVKASGFSVDFTPTGAADMTVDLLAMSETIATSSVDSTPIIASMTRFQRGMGSLTQDLSPLANVTAGSIQFSNGLDPVRTIRGDQKLEGIDEGLVTCRGSLTARFTDTALILDAQSQTPRRFQFSYTLAGNKSLYFDMPRVFLGNPGVEVSGPNGIEVPYPFVAARDSALGYVIRVSLRNQVTAYA